VTLLLFLCLTVVLELVAIIFLIFEDLVLRVFNFVSLSRDSGIICLVVNLYFSSFYVF